MELNDNKIKQFENRDPFLVPDGYFEELTEKIMSRLPDKNMPEKGKFSKVALENQTAAAGNISLYDRIKPWLYMAAAFAGLIILFEALNKTAGTSPHDGSENLISASAPDVTGTEDEGVDFLAYIEDLYAVSYIDDMYEQDE